MSARATRLLAAATAALALLAAAACDRTTRGSFEPSTATAVVRPAKATVRLGSSMQFAAEEPVRPTSRDAPRALGRRPPGALGWPAKWSVVEGPAHGTVSSSGLYQAPTTLPAPPIATVQARLADFAGSTGRAAVYLPDLAPDTMECRGPGQDHVPEPGEYVYVDELPEALVRVAPEYPDSAIQAGAQGTVIVVALVCQSGLVGSAYVVQSVRLLDEAAMAAVIRWTFKPAMAAGTPVAVWVAVPVHFVLAQGQSSVSVGDPEPPGPLRGAPG